ncbi:MAG: phosphatidate cytidylyltransferase [Methylophilaceae bacterium]
MLKTRIITACILITAFIPALFLLSNEVWAIGMLALSLLAVYEWGALIKLNSTQLLVYTLMCAVLGLSAVMLMHQQGFHWFFYRSLLIFFVAGLFWLTVIPFWLAKRFIIKQKVGMALIGLLLLASLWLALICAKGADPWLLLILLVTIWIADSAAYFVGKNYGKHKLAPMISPGKTWEGVCGALLAVSLFAGLLYFCFDMNSFILIPALWGITVLGVIGDLFESLIKRQANLKDSGNLLPGHGGILDRIDGIIPSLPIAILAIYVYHYFQIAQ